MAAVLQDFHSKHIPLERVMSRVYFKEAFWLKQSADEYRVDDK